MSLYSTDQRCPRCQSPIVPGALTCGNCGLALSGGQPMPYGSDSLAPPPPPFPPPPTQGSPFGASAGTDPYSIYNPPTQTPGVAPYYPGSQPQPGFPTSAPTYPGSQPQFPGSVPPPGFPQQPMQQKSGSGLKIALIVLAVLIVLGGGGGVAAFLLTRPKPTITVTSDYKVGATYAGAASTVFHVTGQKFSNNSGITFLLDGQPAPDTQTVQSDGNGAVTADLKVSSNWPVGQHTLTARDASSYTTQSGIQIDVVNQGEAGTPGPNGAPTDSASFAISLTVHPQDAATGEAFKSFDDNISITGQTDPAGGKVCNPKYDDGAPHNSTGQDSNGNKFTETYIWSCTGTYKGGKLTYTETATKDVVKFTDGFTCTAQTPYVYEHLEGTFTDPKTISGTFSADSITYLCSDGKPQQLDAEKGTWSGTSS
jgi:hypothetical protein